MVLFFREEVNTALKPVITKSVNKASWTLTALCFASVLAEDIREAWSPVCRGVIYGLVGKLQFFPGRLNFNNLS